jgi:UDP-N-acetylenolpyruvoylglucosamine reductase
MAQDEIITTKKTDLQEAVTIANKGTHCGMCKVDFLDSGICPSGIKYGFAAYWPEGRMEIVKALYSDKLKPTEELKKIANSCTVCGICDKQCNFTTHLRPEKVAKALKEYVNKLDEKDFEKIPEDNTLKELRLIVGDNWASNDPAVIVSYTKTIIVPDAGVNFYIVMPETTEEVAEVVKYADKNNIPYLPRGNGTLLSMFIETLLAKAVSLEKGIIFDLRRLKKIKIDEENKTATIGVGVTAFELQKEAYKHGMRALVAEAEAHVCVNIASVGIISTWGNTYGWGSDNFTNATLIDSKGYIIHHSDEELANPYSTNNSFTNLTLTPSTIITEATVKLHPIFEDEEAVLVPFETLDDALELAMELAKRRVGLSLAVISSKYLSEFISPTNEIAKDFEYIAKNYLKLNFIVDVVCDKYDKIIVEDLADVTIDQKMMRTLILGSPRFASLKDSEFLKILSEEKDPLKAIFAGPMKSHLEKALDPSPKQIAKIYDEDLQDFFEKVYSKPEMTDVVWLHAFRILPSRLMRQRMFMLRGGYIVADKKKILDLNDMLKKVGDKYNLPNALGFISFLENGKFAFVEYDYYFDHLDPDSHIRLNQSIVESLQLQLKIKGLLPIEYVFHKGLFRKEHLFYPMPKGLSDDELKILGEMVQTVVGG